MNYYIDVKIKPDAEMRENVLLNKVYTKLHKALFTLQATDVGVSFPEYKIKLGKTIRLHSTQDRLTVLCEMNFLGGLAGYCQLTDSLKISDDVMHRTISRVQSNMTEAKLRRLIKRGSITPEQAKHYKAKMFSKGIDNPYFELESTSNKNKHRRYIAFGDIVDTPTSGLFDFFGLSKQATVPWFE